MVFYRCALICYSEKHVLLGVNRGLLTTIGGRREGDENEIQCCCREVYEETKGIIDYRLFPAAVAMEKQIIYRECNYFFLRVEYNILTEIIEKFDTIQTDRKESNELERLVLIDINELVERLIMNNIPYRNELKEFILDVCFFYITQQLNNIHKTIDLDLHCTIITNISDIPYHVCFFETDVDISDLSFVIGKTKDSYITYPFYFEKDGSLFFKNGCFAKM